MDDPTRNARLLRHALKDAKPRGDMLSPQGIVDSREYGEKNLRGRRVTHIGVTGWLRTAQTAMAAIEGAGDVVVPHLDVVEVISRDTSSSEFKNLVAAVDATGEGNKYSVAGMRRTNQNYVEAASALFGRRLSKWLLELPEGANALFVGHSPIIELAVYYLTETKIVVDHLDELGWVDIEYDGFPPHGSEPSPSWNGFKVVGASVKYT